MDSQRWINHFRARATRPDALAGAGPCEWPDGPEKRALAASLAVFQIGETGDGSTVKRWAARAEARGHLPCGYAEAVHHFIAEENHHADLLGRMVLHLGGRLHEKHWIATAFNRVRKLIPTLEFEVQILLSAEIIARAYYGLLGEAVREPAIRSACRSILRDELGHIAFHADMFRHRLAAWTPRVGACWRWQFRLLLRAATLFVWWDHRPALAPLGVTRADFARRVHRAGEAFLRSSTPRAAGQDAVASRTCSSSIQAVTMSSTPTTM